MGRARPTIGARSPHTFSTSCNPLAFSKEIYEVRDRYEGVLCVDLGESFQTHILLQNFVSMEQITSDNERVTRTV